MMHLTHEQLNEYLDGRLDAVVRPGLEAHLGACEQCAADLRALRGLFEALHGLPEVALPPELSPINRARLAPGAALGVSLSPAWQAGLILGVLAWLCMQFTGFRIPAISIRQFSAPQTWSWRTIPPAAWPTLSSVSPAMPADRLAQLIGSARRLAWPAIPTLHVQIPAHGLDLSAFNLALAMSAAGLLWVVGNAMLLSKRNGDGR
jgi:anti-sigma factor RsiW